MRAVSVIAVLLTLVAVALALVPAWQAFQLYFLAGALVLGAIALIALLIGRGAREPSQRVIAEPGIAEPIRPVPAAASNSQAAAEAEIVSFLAMLQDKGRLVDFLMDDITAYDDAQVGAAARVVHTGCKAVLQEHVRIQPVREESEGSTVQIPAGYAADEYRLLGKISGQAPFSGVLVHRGWKTEAVKLPRLLRNAADRLPTIAPAEVELK